jgi:hypothetical protein
VFERLGRKFALVLEVRSRVALCWCRVELLQRLAGRSLSVAVARGIARCVVAPDGAVLNAFVGEVQEGEFPEITRACSKFRRRRAARSGELRALSVTRTTNVCRTDIEERCCGGETTKMALGGGDGGMMEEQAGCCGCGCCQRPGEGGRWWRWWWWCARKAAPRRVDLKREWRARRAALLPDPLATSSCALCGSVRAAAEQVATSKSQRGMACGITDAVPLERTHAVRRPLGGQSAGAHAGAAGGAATRALMQHST